MNLEKNKKIKLSPEVIIRKDLLDNNKFYLFQVNTGDLMSVNKDMHDFIKECTGSKTLPDMLVEIFGDLTSVSNNEQCKKLVSFVNMLVERKIIMLLD